MGKSSGGIPWRVPAVMAVSLTVALSIAIGHDLFYRALNGRPVSSKSTKIAAWTTTAQQVNIAAGTAFAFIFSAALAISTSLAYVQVFFQTVRQKPHSLKSVDKLFSALSDLASFAQVAPHYKYRMLTLMALIIWCLPLAAVFSPAALTVDFAKASAPEVQDEFVPQVAFESLALGHWDCILDPIETPCGAIGPSIDVTRTAVAAAAGGSILPIPPPSANVTWNLDAELPRAVCDVLDKADAEFNTTEENVLEVIKRMSLTSDPPLATHMFQYVSWSDPFGGGPFNTSGPQGGFVLNKWENFPGHITELFLGIFNRVHVDPLSDPFLNDSLIDWYFGDLTLLRCRLSAAQHSIRFTYNGTDQAQFVELISVNETIPIKQNYNEVQLFVPAVNGSRPFSVGAQIGAKVVTGVSDKDILRTFSYNFIWQAFSELVVGASNAAGDAVGKANVPTAIDLCTDDRNNTPNYLMGQDFETQVFTTSLWETNELASLIPRYFINPVSKAPDPSNRTWSAMKTQFDGLVGSRGQFLASRRPLKDALEELFFNITISMAASSSLRYNASSTFAPATVPVTYSLYDNRYLYSPEKLWLPYGLALGAALVAIALGLYVVRATGAAFNADFSTIFRVAKNTTVMVDTREERLPGKTPLPAELGRALLLPTKNAGVSKSSSEESMSRSITAVKSFNAGRSHRRGFTM